MVRTMLGLSGFSLFTLVLGSSFTMDEACWCGLVGSFDTEAREQLEDDDTFRAFFARGEESKLKMKRSFRSL